MVAGCHNLHVVLRSVDALVLHSNGVKTILMDASSTRTINLWFKASVIVIKLVTFSGIIIETQKTFDFLDSI